MSLIGSVDSTGGLSLATTASPRLITASPRLITASPRLITKHGTYRNNTVGSHLTGFTSSTGQERLVFAVLYNHARSKKDIFLRHVWVTVRSVTAVANITLDLITLATINIDFTGQTTGMRPCFFVGDDPDEFPPGVTINLLDPILPFRPSQAFTRSALIATTEFNLGITGAASTANPSLDLRWRDLLHPTGYQPNFNVGTLKLPRGQDGGFAMVVDIDNPTTVILGSIFEFTEEEVF